MPRKTETTTVQTSQGAGAESASQTTATQSASVTLEQALRVIDIEHRFINQMSEAEQEKAQLRQLRTTVVKPYKSAAAIVSQELRVQAKALNERIATTEAPTLAKMDVDTVTVDGQTMTISARVDALDVQAKSATKRFNIAKQALYDAAK